ncbi:Retinoblastoma-associated protein [Phytophthora citrophthora]|uniref:Retinoblastoma-associated protein n=1 Tax=Phytophthora citrophthora TaxID=4793 RepID=A0AAD9GTT3_9STRA|nr:Retinoblastoma-associated protein [Phytophthora citrophthora]
MLSAMASIRQDSDLLQNSQTLYDQILPSASSIGADESNTRSKENEPDKIWALVAVVATQMTQEIKQEKDEEDQHSDVAMDWDLVQLLAEAGVGLQEFLLYFTSLFNRLLLEPELLTAITLLKEEFTIATLLFEKFRVLWEALTPKKLIEKRNLSLTPMDPEPESVVDEQQLNTRSRHRKLFEGGWLLFLLAKRRLGDHYSGLGQLYNLLLATLHLVITNAQASQASVEAEVAAALSAMGALGDGKASPVKSAAGAKTSAQILEALCTAPKVDVADVSRASDHLGLVLQQLRDEDVMQKEAGEHTVLSMTLFADGVLEANVQRLSERYKEDYLDGCGKLDERFFLDARIRRTIMGLSHTDNGNSPSNSTTDSSSRLSTGRSAMHGMLSPVRRNMMARRRESAPSTPLSRGMMTPPRHRQSFQGRGINSPLVHSLQWQDSPGGSRFFFSGASPHPSPGMRTPVSAAVETNSWLRETLSSTVLMPVTPQLRQFFSECAVDPTERIARVLQERSDLLLAARGTSRVTATRVRSTATLMIDDEQEGDADENGNARNFLSGVDDSLKRSTNLSIVLFYRVLEPLLLAERERLRNNDFSKLLNNEVFLAALFACSAEVVLKAHSLITISYPFLLDHLQVNAFHFVTTSESFVKYAPKLPSALKKHMGDVKNRILDSAVWKSDSALYQLLAGSHRSPNSAPGTPLSTSSSRMSDVTPTAPAGHAPVLRLFFRMVLSRAASRIYQLCSLLSLDSTDQNQIWTAVKECITSHQYLLRDRHLDLIVLCNIYAVCKVSRGRNVSQAAATMSFKRLLACYKQLNRQNITAINPAGSSPLASSRSGDGVTHGIILENDKSRGDIIKFYNRCYITPMKVFILQFQCHESQMAAADAVVAEASGMPQSLTPGFMPRREGSNGAMGLAASTSDAESIARAASEAVQKLFQTHNSSNPVNDRSGVLPSTPPRPTRRGVRSSTFVSSPVVSALQLFTSAEVQTLPVSMNQTSPKRVKSSNVFMSPLQQVRLDRRSELTPRSHALYAIGESPARDLALINRAVNTAPANLRRVRAPDLVIDSDTEQEVTTASPAATPVRKKQRTVL